MAAELVLDASVAFKCLFPEEGAERAQQAVLTAGRVVAPDLIFVEVASAAVKSIRHGGGELAAAKQALSLLAEILDEATPAWELLEHAIQIAAESGASVYDSLYVAMAQARDAQVITADMKLIRQLRGTPFEPLVRSL